VKVDLDNIFELYFCLISKSGKLRADLFLFFYFDLQRGM